KEQRTAESGKEPNTQTDLCRTPYSLIWQDKETLLQLPSRKSIDKSEGQPTYQHAEHYPDQSTDKDTQWLSGFIMRPGEQSSKRLIEQDTHQLGKRESNEPIDQPNNHADTHGFPFSLLSNLWVM